MKKAHVFAVHELLKCLSIIVDQDNIILWLQGAFVNSRPLHFCFYYLGALNAYTN